MQPPSSPFLREFVWGLRAARGRKDSSEPRMGSKVIKFTSLFLLLKLILLIILVSTGSPGVIIGFCVVLIVLDILLLVPALFLWRHDF